MDRNQQQISLSTLRIVLKMLAWLAGVGSSCIAQVADGQSSSNTRYGLEQSHAKSSIVASRSTDSRDRAVQVLQWTLLESVWGEAVFCEVRQTTEWFGKKRSGFGKYVRGGKGSGRMRMSLQIPAGDQMNTLLQVSDGELLTTFLSVGQHMSRAQVDLGKVRERLTLTVDSLSDPTTAMYLAIGGQAESVRKLLQQYSWNELQEDKLGEQKVWLLKGTATSQPVSFSSQSLVDVRLFEEDADMQPMKAALIIGHAESKNPFWLYQAEQWCQPASASRSPLYVVTEWDAPTRLNPKQLLPDLFRFPSPEHQASQEIREETKLYLPPLMANTASRGETSGMPR